VAIGLDAIGIDVHDQAADFAAGSFADRHGGRGVGRHPVALPGGGCKDCVAPIGAPRGKRSPARSLLPLGGGAWCGGAHAGSEAIEQSSGTRCCESGQQLPAMADGAARRSPPGCAPGQGLTRVGLGPTLAGRGGHGMGPPLRPGSAVGGDAIAVAGAVRRWRLRALLSSRLERARS
jgi:hypothetical protein